MALLESHPRIRTSRNTRGRRSHRRFTLTVPAGDYQIILAESASKSGLRLLWPNASHPNPPGYLLDGGIALDKARGWAIGAALLKTPRGNQKAWRQAGSYRDSSKPNYLNTRRFYVQKGYKRVSTFEILCPSDHRPLREALLGQLDSFNHQTLRCQYADALYCHKLCSIIARDGEEAF